MGIGPGDPRHLTGRAREVLQAVDVVAGYRLYVELLRPWLGDGKELLPFPITTEAARARHAIALARAGKHVALVSGGDPGVYGMAGLALELLAADGGPPVPVEVVPGVTAAGAAAALLGAPLMQDFAVVSLSDRLVPWSAIEARLRAAAAGDFVTVLYNPASARRPEGIRRARALFLGHRPPATPVGLVRNAMRPGQSVILTDLEHMLDFPVDMLTTVIIGNSATVVLEGRLVTRRGYPVGGYRMPR